MYSVLENALQIPKIIRKYKRKLWKCLIPASRKSYLYMKESQSHPIFIVEFQFLEFRNVPRRYMCLHFKEITETEIKIGIAETKIKLINLRFKVNKLLYFFTSIVKT